METIKTESIDSKEQWIRRFAYRAMLFERELDTQSAFMIAEGQFDDASDLRPEHAAELYVSTTLHH